MLVIDLTKRDAYQRQVKRWCRAFVMIWRSNIFLTSSLCLIRNGDPIRKNQATMIGKLHNFSPSKSRAKIRWKNF